MSSCTYVASIPHTTYHILKAHWGRGRTAPFILRLGAIWTGIASFTLRQSYSNYSKQ